MAGRGKAKHYTQRDLELPSFGDNGQPEPVIRASYYQSSLGGERPLVIVLPIWGTFTYPSRKMSAHIQKHSRGDVHVLHVHGERYLVDWEGLHEATDEDAFLQIWREGIDHQRVSIIDIRRLIDWAEERPEIAANRIGLIGFSFGAIVGGTVLTQEPRLSAAVLLMGGALQHRILANCTGERLTAVRERAARDFGWTAEELEAHLEPITRPIDAASYPGRVDPGKVFLIDAGRDTCIDRTSRDALWEALGRPRRMTMDYGHRKAFYAITPLGFNWMRPKIWQFLESRLLA